MIVGVVERGDLREFSRKILLERVFRGLRAKGKEDYFNEKFGRTDLTSPQALLERLGYSDALLLALLLRPGEYSEPWEIDKFSGLGATEVALPGEPGTSLLKFAALGSGRFGFPKLQAYYLMVSENTEPVRVEVFDDLGPDQVAESARRVYLYSRLLPGYGFPVGLDVADKYAHVPNWLTDAYGKLIRHHLSVSLQRGEVTDAEMRRLLVQAIYISRRDWLFRPDP